MSSILRGALRHKDFHGVMSVFCSPDYSTILMHLWILERKRIPCKPLRDKASQHFIDSQERKKRSCFFLSWYLWTFRLLRKRLNSRCFQPQTSQHCFRRSDLRLVIQVGVDVCRCGKIAVPHPVLNLFHGNAVGQQHRRAAMPLGYNNDKKGNPYGTRVLSNSSCWIQFLFHRNEGSRSEGTSNKAHSGEESWLNLDKLVEPASWPFQFLLRCVSRDSWLSARYHGDFLLNRKQQPSFLSIRELRSSQLMHRSSSSRYEEWCSRLPPPSEVSLLLWFDRSDATLAQNYQSIKSLLRTHVQVDAI